jgi:hypothetical protein
MSDSYTMTRDEALTASKAWVKNRIDNPKSAYSSQKNWLLGQLAARCVAESLRQGEAEWDLERRLQRAWDLVDSIQMNGRRKEVRDLIWKKSEDSMTPEERRLVETAKHQIWRRHDPMRAFREGLDSQHMPSIDKDPLLADCADYFEQPWLRHPLLDYILLDMLITRELVAFGEEIKEHMMPFPRDEIGLNRRYIDHRGNLEAMSKIHWKQTGERLIMWLAWALFIPGAAVMLAFFLGADGVAESLLKIWGGLLAAHFGLRILRGVLKMFGLGRFVDPSQKAKRVWGEMYKVWKTLEGPTVNPAMVKEAMLKSKEFGAAWDSAAYSIIEKVIATDPAVWVVEPSRRD